MDGVNTRKRLGDLLVDEGVLTPQQVDELLSSRIEVDGRLERLGEAAVRLGYCSQDEIGMVLAQQMDLEYRDDHVLPVDSELASRTSRSLAERHLVMPLQAEDGDVVAVACVDPTNIVGLDDVRVAIGARRLRIVVVPTKTLRQTIQEAYGVEARAQQDDFFSAYRKEEEEAEEIEITATSENDGPIIKLADEIILRALTGGASDIHVEPRPDSIVVRNRIDGVLHETMNLPRQISGPLISRIKLIAGLDIAEKRKPQDGRAHFRGSDREEDAVDLRLSTLPTMFGESVVIRLLRRDNARLTPEDIGMSSAQAAQVLSAVERPQGLVLVTGPTGSGKTSTLYTFLQHLATEERKLITVEDRSAARRLCVDGEAVTGDDLQVRKVIDAVRENDISTVFCESTVSQSPAQQVARETGVSYGGVLYVDSLTEADGPVPTYIDLLRVTSETIALGLIK